MAYDFYFDISNEIDELGNTIYLVSKGTTTRNEWGDEVSGTTSSESITAVINDISGDEEFNREGIFSPGDKVFFMKYDEYLSEPNKDSYYIIYNSDNYKIMQVLQPSSNRSEEHTSELQSH